MNQTVKSRSYKKEQSPANGQLASNLKKARKLSIKEGAASSASDGFGTRYITPYALAIGANDMHIGFLSSLPALLGNFSQLYTIKLMFVHSRKTIAVLGALLQALMWLPVIALGFMFFMAGINSTLSLIMLIIIYTILVIFGTLIDPAWDSWMKDIVPEKIRGKYFGIRSGICGLVLLISMFAAGVILDFFKKDAKLYMGFIILFGLAFIFRTISAMLFRRKYEPAFKPNKEYYFSFKQFVTKMSQNNFGRFVIFVALMSFATAIASPFFAVYMLAYLHFSYINYTLVMISSSITTLAFMPVWGKFADSYGNLMPAKICGVLIPLIPFLWLAATLILKNNINLLVPCLMCVEAFSGFAWAGFNLAANNFMYDAVTRERIGLCAAYFNIVTNIGIFFGAIIGGFIASMSFIFFGLIPILFVFMLSGIIRLIVSLIMAKKIKEVREVQKFEITEVKDKVLASLSK